MKIAVRAARDIAEALAAVAARDQRPAGFVNLVLVFWIDDQVSEIEWPPDHVLTTIEMSPCFAVII